MSNSIQVRVERLYLVVSTTKNWPIAILIWLGLINFGLVRFKNDELFKLSKANWVQYLERVYLFHYFPDAKIFDEIVKFNYKNKDLVFDCGRYGLGTVLEIFAGEPYREFFETTKIKGKTVIDIGAAFGDTAIAFLLAGAGRVYAVEAFPGYCRLASKNIETNGNVFMISGCTEQQTSADSFFNNRAQGAMTWALLESLKTSPTETWRELIKSMRDLLKTSEYDQIPQFASGKFVDIDSKVFI